MSAHIRLARTQFATAFKRTLAGSKRKAEAVATEQTKGILRRLIRETPPGKSGRGPAAAKKAGTNTVKAQIAKVVQGVHPARATTQDVRGAHSRARRKGRVTGETRGAARVKVPRRALKEYIKQKVAEVGRLAAGWKKAAAKFKVSMPTWMTRHNSPGSGEINVSERGIRIRLKNAVGYASGVSDIYKRIASALRGQGRSMERRMAQQAEQAAKDAGLGK